MLYEKFPHGYVESTHDVEAEQASEKKAHTKRLATNAIAMTVGSILGVGAVIGVGNSSAITHTIESATSFTEQNNAVSDIATELTGIPIRVDCHDDEVTRTTLYKDGEPYSISGYVRPLDMLVTTYSPPVMTLKESICDTITSFDPTSFTSRMGSDDYYTYWQESLTYADAIGVVLHESEHIRQISDEAEATCYSYQKLPEALAKLGMDQTTALDVASVSATIKPTKVPSEYLSEQCQPGGEYDLGISDVYVIPDNTQLIAYN